MKATDRKPPWDIWCITRLFARGLLLLWALFWALFSLGSMYTASASQLNFGPVHYGILFLFSLGLIFLCWFFELLGGAVLFACAVWLFFTTGFDNTREMWTMLVLLEIPAMITGALLVVSWWGTRMKHGEKEAQVRTAEGIASP